MSANASPAYWWVNQGATYDEAREEGFIWAPKESKSGARLFHWENVSRVRSGDIIFHYADGELKAISKAKTNGYDAKKELGGNQWSDDGWRVDSDYFVLADPVPISEIGSKLARLQLDKGPVNRAGGVNQGYLFELPPAAVGLLLAKMGAESALETLGLNQMSIPNDRNTGRSTLDGLCKLFLSDLEIAAVRTEESFVRRLISAMLAKRFLVLTGLAGSGKTKLAQAFARWITPDPDLIDPADPSKGKHRNPKYVLLPVGADWTSNENIVGYPDGLDSSNYITKPALELIRHSLDPANVNVPHFLILDEMNLSHVERYFADLLSAIESGEEIPLYEGTDRNAGEQSVPRRLRLPENLFVIGTVNVDETTYMFSPKVLDRANVIEFRVEPTELAEFLTSPRAPQLEMLDGKGAAFGHEFVSAASDSSLDVPASVKPEFEREMLRMFDLLRTHNAEFGYRTSYEAARFIHFYNLLGGHTDGEWFSGAMDAVIVQKFLPKLHGSRSKLEGLLWALAWACGKERITHDEKDFDTQLREASEAQDEARYSPDVVWAALRAKDPTDPAKAAPYPLSYDKVMRMWRKLVRDQFVSFAEA
jgi:MoxR-like ATPase